MVKFYFIKFILIFRRTKAATNRRKSTSHISILPGAKPLSPLAHSAHVPVSPLARTPSPGHSERLQVRVSFYYGWTVVFTVTKKPSKSVCNFVHQNQGSRGASWVTVSGRSSPVMGRPVMRRRASLASCPEVEYVSKAFYECEVITWHNIFFGAIWLVQSCHVIMFEPIWCEFIKKFGKNAWYRWWFPSKPIFEILGISLLMCPNCTFTSHDDVIIRWRSSSKLYRCKKGRIWPSIGTKQFWIHDHSW